MTQPTKIERILALMQVLNKYTDENHELSLIELTDRLIEEFDENTEITSSAVRRDLKELQSSKYYDLIAYQEDKGLPMTFSYQNKVFEIHELRLLMDAIPSARFITKTEKGKILEKIKELTSNALASNLENQIYVNELSGNEESNVKYIIFDLHNAIQDNKVIQFKYGRFNVNKQFILSNEGKYRELHPYALFWNNDYYYLIGKYPNKKDIRHFRIDRMRDVFVTDSSFLKDQDFNLSSYTQQLFHMYSGVQKDLKVRFDNHLINVIIDRFGKGVYIEPDGKDTFILRTKAIISEGLVRWLLTWGSDAKVLDPPELVKKMKEECAKMNEMYES
ncbi:WYL domain-containing protein [Virgibacillus sp. C22-A2]|uniref:WYL domain-containing protein n=1 Tax=Virgibacillus tibetensis TaxID=3042313 RepID=A0ABU6KL35_9BACI|nr:WYL domain-containing protein [Virgibacillus sp. C22-A2]